MATIIRHLYNQLADRKDAKQMSDVTANELRGNLKAYFNERYERTQALNSTEHGFVLVVYNHIAIRFIL